MDRSEDPTGGGLDATAGPPNREWRVGDLVIIATICLTIYLAGNSRISLWDRDEPWYAECAREMLQRGDLVVPSFNGQPRFQKPVLIYWLMAAAYTIFGDNEFGARFFSGIAGTVSCLLTYRLATRMGDRAAGLAAALMLAVSPLMLIESKLATTDAVLLALLLGAISCLWELHLVGFSRRWSLTFWGLLGLAVLTKGPVGLGMVVSVVLAWLMLSRQGKLVQRLNWIAGPALCAAVVSPWAVAIYFATDGEFYRTALGQEAVAHSMTTLEHHHGFPGYYFATAVLGLFPWSLGLPFALAGVRRWAREDGPGSFLLGWMIGPMLLVELMGTKLPHYYLAAYPAWALLIARGLSRFHAAGGRLVQFKLGRVAVLAGVVAAAGASLALAAFALAALPRVIVFPALCLAMVLACGTAAAAWCLLRAADRTGWATLLGSWCLMAVVAAGWLLPQADSCRVQRAAAEGLRARADGQVAVVLHSYREPSLVYYLGGPVPTLRTAEELCGFMRTRGPVMTVIEERDLAALSGNPGLHVDGTWRFEGPSIRGIPSKPLLVTRLSPARSDESLPTAAGDRAARQ